VLVARSQDLDMAGADIQLDLVTQHRRLDPRCILGRAEQRPYPSSSMTNQISVPIISSSSRPLLAFCFDADDQ
jgi:hypothetical protein